MKVYMAGFEKMIHERIQTVNMLSSIIFAAINEPPAAWRLIRNACFARVHIIYVIEEQGGALGLTDP